MVFVYLLFLALFSLEAQERPVTLDQAIEAAGSDIVQKLELGSVVAVVNFKSSSEAFSDFVIDKLIDLLSQNERFTVVDRKNLEFLNQEKNFQKSGDVNDENAKSIGKMLGAKSIIIGSFDNAGSFVIKSLNVESGQVESSTLRTVPDNDPHVQSYIYNKQPPVLKSDYLWSAGVSIGTSFATPWLIATVHGTLAPLRNSFLELGCDFGWVSCVENDDYYSIYPFAHCAFFQPIGENGGWYIGAGGGRMYASYTVDGEYFPVDTWALHLTTGFNICNYFDFSYTFRTNFVSANHKVSVGCIYRFK